MVLQRRVINPPISHIPVQKIINHGLYTLYQIINEILNHLGYCPDSVPVYRGICDEFF